MNEDPTKTALSATTGGAVGEYCRLCGLFAVYEIVTIEPAGNSDAAVIAGIAWIAIFSLDPTGL